MTNRPVRELKADSIWNFSGSATPQGVYVDEANTLVADTTSTHVERVLTQDSTYVLNNVVLGDHPAGYCAPGEISVRFVVYNQKTDQTDRQVTTTPAEDNVVWFVGAGTDAAIKNTWTHFSQTLTTPLSQIAGAGTGIYFDETTSEVVVTAGVYLATLHCVMSSIFLTFSWWLEDGDGAKLLGQSQTTQSAGLGSVSGFFVGPKRVKIKWAGTYDTGSNQPFRISLYVKRISSIN